MSRERRPLFATEEPEAEPGRYGCSMLVRTRFKLNPEDRLPVMRCSLGWALHNDFEVARCMAVNAMTDCWKVHPERSPIIVHPLAADEAVVADD